METERKINSILKDVLKKIQPPEKDLKIINNSLARFLIDVKKKIKNLKINAEIFVGGSFSKNTLIKKDIYDIDVFIRFEKNYKEISEITKKIIKGIKNPITVHGSRDYFKIKVSPIAYIELIPVIKINNPKDAENITDLSYSHVNYINKRIKKNKKILEDIMLAKAFCYANNCYGAESYISGFSGYGLELLVYHYGGFLRFIKEMVKIRKEKLIIDIEKQHKNKQDVFMNLNSSKLHSPIILIDPTYKQRNVLAALSDESFEKFKKVCAEFLRKPNLSFFELKKPDIEKIKKYAKEKKYEFSIMKIETNRQEGDIAGSKLLKFYKHIKNEIEKYFEIKKTGFEYTGKKIADCFFVVKSKGEIFVSGPETKDKENVKSFKKIHKKNFVKKNRVYASEKVDFSLKEFIDRWKNKNREKLRDMSISELSIKN